MQDKKYSYAIYQLPPSSLWWMDTLNPKYKFTHRAEEYFAGN